MKIDTEAFINHFQKHFNEIDEVAITTLKGHLLIENVLNLIIEDFVFHGEMIEKARLSFTQKVHLAKSISLDNSNENTWNLILSLNKLRNNCAHNLESKKREQLLSQIKDLCTTEAKKPWDEAGEIAGIAGATSYCIGFLEALHKEVKRFKEVVDQADKVFNPHRHKK